MGGGSSESKTTNYTTTSVDTDTTTRIRDIGFTGAQAVDMAAVIETGSIARDEISAEVLNNLVQATGNAWNQLIGGAGKMVETSAIVSENVINQLPMITKEATKPLEEVAEAIKEGKGNMVPIAIAVAGVGVLGFLTLSRKR